MEKSSYTKYFIAAGRHLLKQGILPEISQVIPEEEDDVERIVSRIGWSIPPELLDYYGEIGSWFKFSARYSTDFMVSPLSDLPVHNNWARNIMEDTESVIQNPNWKFDADLLKAEAERRANWLPFYNIGGGGYTFCLDTALDPSPVYYHEIHWITDAPAKWNFELAPSFREFIRQWSRYCFVGPHGSLINFCMGRTGTFDWGPDHFDSRYDRGTADA